MSEMTQLALFGGPKAITAAPGDLFTWPIITSEEEEAVLNVLRRGAMSGSDVTSQFEKEYATWQGASFALAHSTGTAAVEAAMVGCKVATGDEIVCPSVTYWASCLQVYSLRGTVVFAEVDPVTLCIDPADIERRVTPRTRAILVVHYMGHPAEMDDIMAIARRHGVKVIEDVSHAQGGMYKGRKVGSIGDVAATSLMSGKSLVAGEAGMLTTNNREIYERACAWGHYERYQSPSDFETPYLKEWAGLPLGGRKYRMHQMSAAVGRAQLKHYDARCEEIRKAMNCFWDCLEGTPGLRAHRTPQGTGSNMGGWYSPHGHYLPEELGGLSVTRFTQALAAEGFRSRPGVNMPLHLHPLLNDVDVYGEGAPTRIAHSGRDLRQPRGSLPVSEAVMARTFSVPWFKHRRPEIIAQYAQAFRKVAENYHALLEGDPGNPPKLGSWNFFGQR